MKALALLIPTVALLVLLLSFGCTTPTVNTNTDNNNTNLNGVAAACPFSMVACGDDCIPDGEKCCVGGCTEPVVPDVETVVPDTPAEISFDSGIVFASDTVYFNGIFFMDESGANLTRLSPVGEKGDSHPSVSYDGKKIVFDNGGIWTMNIDGTNRTRLIEDYSSNHNPTWSPDGKKIYYSKFSVENEGGTYIYSINSDGSGETLLSPLYVSDDPSQGQSHDSFPSVSPDGTKIAFTTTRQFPTTDPEAYREMDGRGGVMVMNVDGSDMKILETGKWDYPFQSADSLGQRVYENLFSVGGLNGPGVSWSPDGTKIVFTTNPTDSVISTQIYVMNSDGTKITELTSDGGADSYGPSWSPDGKKIVFWKVDIYDDDAGVRTYNGDHLIYSMNADGSSQKEITIQIPPSDIPVYGLELQPTYPCFIKKSR